MNAPRVDVSVLRWLPVEVPANGAVHEGLARLIARVPVPGVRVGDADVSVDGRLVQRR